MAIPLRIEFAGALYHITSRGDRQEAIYEDDEDHEMFLAVLAEVVERYHWICHAYCLMTNHYHLVIETGEGNLSKGPQAQRRPPSPPLWDMCRAMGTAMPLWWLRTQPAPAATGRSRSISTSTW
jgi:hypothetical protein